jgi:hypothetical protein
MNTTGQTVIANGILFSATLYFLALWGGTQTGIKKITAQARNFVWSG